MGYGRHCRVDWELTLEQLAWIFAKDRRDASQPNLSCCLTDCLSASLSRTQHLQRCRGSLHACKRDMMLSEPRPAHTPAPSLTALPRLSNSPALDKAAKSAVPGHSTWRRTQDLQVRTTITFDHLSNMANAFVLAITPLPSTIHMCLHPKSYCQHALSFKASALQHACHQDTVMA